MWKCQDWGTFPGLIAISGLVLNRVAEFDCKAAARTSAFHRLPLEEASKGHPPVHAYALANASRPNFNP